MEYNKFNIYELIVDNNGQIKLPDDIISRFNIRSGQKLIMTLKDDELIILPKIEDPISMFAMTANKDEINEFKESKLDFD